MDLQAIKDSSGCNKVDKAPILGVLHGISRHVIQYMVQERNIDKEVQERRERRMSVEMKKKEILLDMQAKSKDKI